MKIMNFSCPDFPSSVLETGNQPLYDGLYVIDRQFPFQEETKSLAAKFLAAGKQFILGFRFRSDQGDDEGKVAAAAEITKDLALATSPPGEWSPDISRSIESWVALCDKYQARWVCPFIHMRLLPDLHKFEVRDALAANDVQVVVLCGYMLARAALGQSVPTYFTALNDPQKSPAKQWGLSQLALQSYLDPLNAYSGVGGMRGIDRGSISSCHEVGFKGIVCAAPFDVTGWEQKRVAIPQRPNFKDHDKLYSLLVDETWE
jgi:hypothetical protein